MEFRHESVLLEEVLKYLNIHPEGVYVDGTLGGGGHAYYVAERLSKKGRLVGIDQDDAAIGAAGERLSVFGDKVLLVRDNYRNTAGALKSLGIEKVDGILLDLGVSSYQLDNLERGFSYKYDTGLDMRMDQRQRTGAKEIINEYSFEALCKILREYGEEKFAPKIAGNIIKAREKKPIETTGELNEIIRQAIPSRMRAAGGHPSKRTFQAVRIECNRELEVLRESLDLLVDLLKPGGRICIITFHSLEDRIVKTAFREKENPCICPPSFPVCTCGRTPVGSVITRKPILPTEEEIARNSRAKSAKLRVLEKR